MSGIGGGASRASTRLARLLRERRVIGDTALIGSLVGAGALVGGALALQRFPGAHAALVFATWLTLQVMLPLFVGMLAAGLVPDERAGEVLLAMPARYRQIALTRLLLLTSLAAVVVVCALATLAAAQAVTVATPFPSAGVGGWLAALLACLAPLACCSAVGWGLAVALRSAAASRAVVALAWIGLAASSAMSGAAGRWLLVQAGLLAVGAFATLIGWVCLWSPEYLAQRMERSL